MVLDLGRRWVVLLTRRAILASVCDLSGSGVLEILKILNPTHTAAIKLFFFLKVYFPELGFLPKILTQP